jgi:hypothetical protein
MQFAELRGPQPPPCGGPLLFADAHIAVPAGCCPHKKNSAERPDRTIRYLFNAAHQNM